MDQGNAYQKILTISSMTKQNKGHGLEVAEVGNVGLISKTGGNSMKSIAILVLLVSLFACVVLAQEIEERDYGKRSTYNVVAIPANTVTTLNLRTNNRYFIELFNWRVPEVWIGTDRFVSPNTKGRPLYPSSNVGIKGDKLWFGVSNTATTLSVYVEHQ